MPCSIHTFIIFCVHVFVVICFWTQVRSALCDNCTIFPFFLCSALFYLYIFLWDFSEEICEFGAAFDYSWESARRNTESLGFCTWLFPGLVFIVPRKSIFPLSILIHFLSLSMVLDHLLFFPIVNLYFSGWGIERDHSYTC